MTEKQKFQVKDLSGNNFYPDESFRANLENILIYPEGEYRRGGIPNGSVWVYKDVGQKYDQRFLFNDVGCGMAAFSIPRVDVKKAADTMASSLKGTRVLGSGNHFIDLCGSFSSKFEDTEFSEGYILAVHTDAKTLSGNHIAQTFEQAEEKTRSAESLREKIGKNLANTISYRSKSVKLIGNWSHNTVERKNGKIIYRKGSIKVEPNKIYMLPAHLGASILFYSLNENNMPPLESMPHATGRNQATGKAKVELDKVKELREMVYIPSLIKDSSIRSEHPDCFNDADHIYRDLGKYLVVLGDAKILAYVGKI